ncbi:MAG TPA: glycoside hydrolase family 140 protein [Chloroflexota bacterium]|nr:glycoside hydrolase family 140 protein [Chloroflexota bacterium]
MNVSANRRFLEHSGKPFFYLADTSWKLLTAPSEEEADFYLRTRKEQGFTVVMPVLATERARGEENERSAFLDDDPSRPDEQYFAKADRIIRHANELGLWVAILPTWGSYVGGNERDTPILDEAAARRYGEYVGRRYQDDNVIWVNGGDRNVRDEQQMAAWRALAAGLQAGDKSGQHVMTFHPPGLRPDPANSGTSSRWFHDDPWLDFNMLQTGLRFLEVDQCARYLAEYTRQPTKPFVDGETRYENSHRNFGMPNPTGPKIRAHHVRQAAHYAMLCGALGHTYGSRDVWSFYVPSDQPPTRGVDMHWKSAIHLPGAEQLHHWRQLFETYPWYCLSPDLPTNTSTIGALSSGRTDGALVTQGAWDGVGNIRTPAAIADDASFALVYLPLQMPVWVDLGKLKGKAVDTLWYDPRTGEARPIKRYHEKGEVRFYPPGDETEPDWVLILRSVS